MPMEIMIWAGTCNSTDDDHADKRTTYNQTTPANSHALGVSLTPAGRKLRSNSHA